MKLHTCLGIVFGAAICAGLAACELPTENAAPVGGFNRAGEDADTVGPLAPPESFDALMEITVRNLPVNAYDLYDSENAGTVEERKPMLDNGRFRFASIDADSVRVQLNGQELHIGMERSFYRYNGGPGQTGESKDSTAFRFQIDLALDTVARTVRSGRILLDSGALHSWYGGGTGRTSSYWRVRRDLEFTDLPYVHRDGHFRLEVPSSSRLRIHDYDDTTYTFYKQGLTEWFTSTSRHRAESSGADVRGGLTLIFRLPGGNDPEPSKGDGDVAPKEPNRRREKK